MDSQYKLLSELLSDQAAFLTSPKTNLANYWGSLPPQPPQCLRAWVRTQCGKLVIRAHFNRMMIRISSLIAIVF